MGVVPRKVFVSGSSYIITLPKDWLERNGIKAGDVVYLEIGKDSLRITPSLVTSSEKEAYIEETKNAESLVRKIISHYLAGYTSIRVKVTPENRKAVFDATSMLIGAEVIEDYVNELRIEIFHSERRFRPDELLEKMASITTSMHADVSKCMKKFDRSICESVVDREKEVDKLYFLLLRQLKMAAMYQDVASLLNLKPREILGYRIVMKSVERVADHLFVMAESMLEAEKSCELYDVSEKTRSVFKMSVNSFFKRDERLAEEVFEISKGIKDELKNLEIVGEAEEIILRKTISDGLSRIVGYSEDIAEIVLNLSIE